MGHNANDYQQTGARLGQSGSPFGPAVSAAAGCWLLAAGCWPPAATATEVMALIMAAREAPTTSPATVRLRVKAKSAANWPPVWRRAGHAHDGGATRAQAAQIYMYAARRACDLWSLGAIRALSGPDPALGLGLALTRRDSIAADAISGSFLRPSRRNKSGASPVARAEPSGAKESDSGSDREPRYRASSDPTGPRGVARAAR